MFLAQKSIVQIAQKMHPPATALRVWLHDYPLCGHQGSTEHTPGWKVLPIWVTLSQPAAKLQVSKAEK